MSSAAVAQVTPRPTLAVGIVGVGAMGFPMALRLQGGGLDVRAVDVVPASVDRCRDAGLTAATTTDHLAGCDVVLVMVATALQLDELLDAPVVTGGGLRGAVLVVMSTVGPEALRSAAAVAASYGVEVVDCPVSGGVVGATDGTLALFVAGEPTLVERVRPVLELTGRPHVVGERPGDGQSVKLVNQMLASIHLVAAAEATAFAQRLGLDADVVRPLLLQGAASSWMLGDRGPRLAADVATRPVQSHLDIFVKDSGLVAAAARDAGQLAPLTEVAADLWSRAAAAGLGRGDDSGVIEMLRAP